jgi:hypothetical protein
MRLLVLAGRLIVLLAFRLDLCRGSYASNTEGVGADNLGRNRDRAVADLAHCRG